MNEQEGQNGEMLKMVDVPLARTNDDLLMKREVYPSFWQMTPKEQKAPDCVRFAALCLIIFNRLDGVSKGGSLMTEMQMMMPMEMH